MTERDEFDNQLYEQMSQAGGGDVRENWELISAIDALRQVREGELQLTEEEIKRERQKLSTAGIDPDKIYEPEE